MQYSCGYCKMKCSYLQPGEGHSHWKGVWGCAVVMTPFFHASRRSLAYHIYRQCAALVTPFSIFRKCLHFQPCFGHNSSSLDTNFSKFSFPIPPFFKENQLPRPYISKPLWHTSTKKKDEYPLGLAMVCYSYIYSNRSCYTMQ